jgi:hypothetical protein
MTISNEGFASMAPTSTNTSSEDPVTNDTTAAFPPYTKAKLHGRAFYESIGSPKFVLAPMVDQSEFVRPNFLPFLNLNTTDDHSRPGVS